MKSQQPVRLGAVRTPSFWVALGIVLAVAPLAHAQPRITKQPTDQFVDAGKSVSLSFLATSATPYTNQWFFNGQPLPDATNPTLRFASAQPNLNGEYFAVRSDASGSATSQVARIQVFAPAPHSIAGLQLQRDGTVTLELAGETSGAMGQYYDLYPIETSSNLVDWVPLVTLQRTNTALEPLRFDDANAPGKDVGFYRTPTNQLATPDPVPRGPYAVGTLSMVMTDPSRTNTIGKTNYQFMATVWYPAIAQAGVLPAKYAEPQVASSQFNNFGGQSYASRVSSFFSHSQSNAPMASGPSKCPVLLYSPGYINHRRCATDQEEELASWGYVVIGLDGFDCYASVFPDGRVANGVWAAQTQAQWNAAVDGRMRDMQFVIDELNRLNASDPRLGGRLDLDHIGAFGWSIGGSAVAQLCLREPRCRAGAGMDGTFFQTNVLTQPLNAPFLYFRAADGVDPDPSPGGLLPDGRPDDRVLVYSQQITNAYWVKLASSVHGTFADQNLIVDSASLAAVYGTSRSGQYLPPARASKIIQDYLLSFFNKFLKGEDDHLLDGPSPAYPDVEQFMSTSRVSSPPRYPSAGLLQGSDGSFYGTTLSGGGSGLGTVFRVTSSGVLTTLASFNGGNGSRPSAALTQGRDGNLYGTTPFGGSDANHGTVFKMTPDGALTLVAALAGTNGSHPFAGLIDASDGNLYGTTISGGAYGFGTVFKLTPAGLLEELASFKNPNGFSPYGALVEGGDGNFYGTTGAGVNSSTGGGVFRITPGGALTNLSGFTGPNGLAPAAGLVQLPDGNFYGTTELGGDTSLNLKHGLGTVFKMTPPRTLTTLVSFNGSNGSFCVGALILGRDGNLYGMTAGGGSGGGTVFRMTPAGALTTLVAFTGANGSCPLGSLVEGSDGNFYGTTQFGGISAGGTVFQMTPAGVLKSLVTFGSRSSSP